MLTVHTELLDLYLIKKLTKVCTCGTKYSLWCQYSMEFLSNIHICNNIAVLT